MELVSLYKMTKGQGVVQRVRVLVIKLEDLCLNPQHQHKSLVWLCVPVIPVLRVECGGDGWKLKAGWLACL